MTSIFVKNQARSYVRQHCYGSLSRLSDDGGLDYWTSEIAGSGTNQLCIDSRRLGVSAAYFIELEFQETGAFVYRFYKAPFGNRPAYGEFMPDRSSDLVSLKTGRTAFADQWVQRPAFIQKYPLSLSETEFIDAILKTMLQESGVDLTDHRAAYIADYNTNASRGRIVRMIAENADFKNAEFNRAFVLMQCFGHLRRDPDQGRYQFWQNNLNNEPNNFRGMVCAFITSADSGAFQAVVSVTIASAAACLSKIYKRYVSCNVRGRP